MASPTSAGLNRRYSDLCVYSTAPADTFPWWPFATDSRTREGARAGAGAGTETRYPVFIVPAGAGGEPIAPFRTGFLSGAGPAESASFVSPFLPHLISFRLLLFPSMPIVSATDPRGQAQAPPSRQVRSPHHPQQGSRLRPFSSSSNATRGSCRKSGKACERSRRRSVRSARRRRLCGGGRLRSSG